MTLIADLLTNATKPTISVEFFPPKTPAGEEALQQTLKDLRSSKMPLTYVSVTYGAGGTTREHTRDLVVGMNASEPYPAMAHLTCIGHTKAELEALLDDYEASGVRNILALAGDPPADGSPAVGDFTFAQELVDLIRNRAGSNLTVAVAAHPELHPRSTDRGEDRKYLAAKLAASDFAITQFFFNPDDYFRMVEDVEAATPGNKTKPILPGIMPLTNIAGVRRMATMSAATFPEELAQRIESADEEDRPKLVVEAAVDLCRALLEGGAPGLHLYGLNRSETVLAIIDKLADEGLLG